MWRSESHSSVLAAKLANLPPPDLEWALPSGECESCRRQETKKTVKLFKNVVYRKKTHSSSASSSSSSSTTSRPSISSSFLGLQNTHTAPTPGEYTHNHPRPSHRTRKSRESNDNIMPSGTSRSHKHLSSPTPGRSRSQRPAVHNRTLSQGPYCVRRPSLAQILANQSAPPWTLADFREYCRQNMCLENLEFTIEAKHYQTTYNQLYSAAAAAQADRASPADATAKLHLKVLWRSLILSYIARNGIQEINLPATTRDNLLLIPESQLPPPPEVLAPALGQIYALMEDSILLSFLNDVRPSSSRDHMNLDFSSRAFKARSMYVESSAAAPADDELFPSPFADDTEQPMELESGSTSLSSLPFSRGIRPKYSLITKRSHSSSTPSVSGDPGLTDDNISFTTRAASDTNEMASPPRTPPTSNPATRTSTVTNVKSPSGSSKAKNSHSASESIKRMGNKLGLRSSKKNTHANGAPGGKRALPSSTSSSTSFF